MAAFAWVMMGLAIWHFTIFLPDRFWGGIVGAFLGALFGAFIFGVIVNGGTIPGQDDTHLLTAAEAIPGAVIGIALVYLAGVRQERQPAAPAGDGRVRDRPSRRRGAAPRVAVRRRPGRRSP